MLKVYNTSTLSQKQRFWNAVLFGSLASIVLVIAYVIIFNLMISIGFEFAIAYIAVGYAIGLVVQHSGHGVQLKFSILAAVLCALIIIFGDLFTLRPDLISQLQFGEAGLWLIQFYFAGFSNIISLAFRIFGIVYAFTNARVL